MHKFFGRSQQPSGGEKPLRDPVAAAALSVVPGLGQLYNGQAAKGFLFFDVGVVNFVILWLILFTEPIVRAVNAFSQEFHFHPNTDLLHALTQMHLGTAVSNVMLILIAGFGLFAARDAYDAAKDRQRKALYWDSIINLPEAASGSYLLHFAMIMALGLLAMFLLLPPAPRTQVTDIEFITNKDDTKPPPQNTKRAANKATTSNAEFNPAHQPRQEQHRAAASRTAASSASESHAAPQHAVQPPAHSQPAEKPPAAAESTPAPSKPVPLPVKPNLLAMAPPAMPLMPHPPTAVKVQPAAAVPMPVLQNSMVKTPVMPAPMPTQAAATSPVNPTPVAHKMNLAAGSPVTPLPNVKVGGNPEAMRQPMPAPVPGHGTGINSVAPAPAEAPSSIGSRSSSTVGPTPSRAPEAHGNTGDKPAIAARPVVSAPGSDLTDQRGSSDTHSIRKGPDISARKEVNFGDYMAKLQRRIKMHWIPPRTPNTKRVQACFKITTSGELLDLRLTQSSGFALSDEAALKAIREAAPFPHLPEGADDVVDIQFTFDYNVFGGGVGSVRY